VDCRAWMLVVVVCAWLSGCASFMAYKIEHPDHMGGSPKQMDAFLRQVGFAREAMRTNDGVRIAYWIASPRAYQIHEQVEERHRADGSVNGIGFKLDFGEQDPAAAAPLPTRGSVVLLHPWGMEGSAMMPWALRFAAAGYVSVMPDLRDQGDSDKAPVGYGPREARDIVELIRTLQASGRLRGPLYLFGVSYGGSVALFAAPDLPDIRAVIAMEPYANAADTIRRAPSSGLFGHEWLAHWIRSRDIDAGLDRASRQLGVDLNAIDAGDAVARSTQCLLVLRGSRDNLMPDDALRKLSARSPRSYFAEIPSENHLSLPLRTDRLFQPLLDWMQSVPDDASGACPTFAWSSAASPASES
jgi:pimeloyl-ACP methyl ester carboxylesterase